jgi:hypothetical protein
MDSVAALVRGARDALRDHRPIDALELIERALLRLDAVGVAKPRRRAHRGALPLPCAHDFLLCAREVLHDDGPGSIARANVAAALALLEVPVPGRY